MRRASQVTLLVVLSTAQPADASEAHGELAAGIAGVETAIDAADWERARDELAGLTAGEYPVAELLVERARIVRDLERVHFWLGRERPTIADLTDVEIERFRESDGSIRLRWRDGVETDLLRDVSGLPDYGLYGPHRLFPIPFAGDIEIVVEGTKYPPLDSTRYAELFVGCDAAGFTKVSFGNGHMFFDRGQRRGDSSIARFGKLRGDDFASAGSLDSAEQSAIRPGQPFKLAVEVRGKRIKVSSNGKKHLSGKAEEDVRGWFGLGRLDFTELVVEGRVDTDWLRLRLDQILQVAWNEFRADFDPDPLLPPGLRRADFVDDELALITLETDWWPGDRDQAEHEVVLETVRLLESKAFDEAQEFLNAVDVTEIDEEFRAYLAGWIAFFAGRDEDALKAWDSIVVQGFELGPAEVQRARLLAVAGDYARARIALEALLEADCAAWALGQLADLELSHGRTERARACVARAVAAGLYGARTDRVATTLVLARRGPAWEVFHEELSSHFHVVSDLDRRSCIEAAQRLEVGLARFSKALVPVEVTDDRRFRVYLFSGRSGYEGYLADLGGVRIENTAGVYSRALRQLLIWEGVDHDATLATVRHEGFHQYFHLVASDPPTWLNEGLAEYWELADFTKSASRMIPERPDYWRIVSLSPHEIGDFVRFGRAPFLAAPGLFYPQAFATVHFLQHSTPANRATFDRLIEELVAGAGANDAVEVAFAGVDPVALEVEFREYVEERLGR